MQPPPPARYLLLLELPDGALGLLQVLGRRAALLPHHRQLPLDDVVLLRLLRPCHLPLSTGRTGHRDPLLTLQALPLARLLGGPERADVGGTRARPPALRAWDGAPHRVWACGVGGGTGRNRTRGGTLGHTPTPGPGPVGLNWRTGAPGWGQGQLFPLLAPGFQPPSQVRRNRPYLGLRHSRGRAPLAKVGVWRQWRAEGLRTNPSGQGWEVEHSSSGTFSSPESWGLHLPGAKTSPYLIPSTHPIRVPPFQARSHQVAGRSFQIKPFKMRQQQKQVREDGRPRR